MKTSNKNQLIFFFPVFSCGGVEKNFYNISNFISKKSDNLNISLITFSKNDFVKNINKKIDIHCFPKSLQFFPRRLKFILCSFLLLFKCLMNKKSTIFSFQGNFYALTIASILKNKIIIRSNLYPRAWIIEGIKLKIFKFLIKTADKIIVNSDEFKLEFENIFKVKCKRIYNPICWKKNKLKASTSEDFYQKDTINLINIGRLVEQKNQIQICKAIACLKQKKKLRLIIIGNGPEREKILNFIKKQNLKKIIKIYRHHENKNYLLKQADVFILSSKNEGLPNVLLEAAILKKYIISSNCKSGPKEILANYKNGTLYHKNKMKELALILKNLDKQKILKEKSKVKIDFTKEIFNDDFNLNEYLKTIKEVFKKTSLAKF